MSATRYLLTFLLLFTMITAAAGDNDIFFRENFNDLENWKAMNFPKIKKHSIYSIERQGEGSYLKTESSASASAIVFNKTYNVFDYPRVKWRWKVNNVYKKGNAVEKSGDDYPIRIFIMFKYDPDKATFKEKITYGLAKLIYGVDPPYSSLNYIWESRKHDADIITNTYASQSKMILLQAGPENVGEWVEEDVDIIRDYRRAFGKDPPAIASIAIMNDSDDTGESSISYIDYIEVFR